MKSMKNMCTYNDLNLWGLCSQFSVKLNAVHNLVGGYIK